MHVTPSMLYAQYSIHRLPFYIHVGQLQEHCDNKSLIQATCIFVKLHIVD